MKLLKWKHYLIAGTLLLSVKFASADAMMMAGVKTMGMAGTSTAYPIDCFAGAYNPAGMTLICSRFDLGIGTMHQAQRLHFTSFTDPAFVDLNGSRNGANTSAYYNGEFGINKEFCFQFCNRNVELAVGVIGYNRNFIKTRYKRPLSLFGTTHLGYEYLHETVSPIVALRICNRHSFGISANYQIQRMKIDGLENFATSAFSVAPTHVTNHGYDYSTGWGLTFGYLWEFNDCFRFGVAYQPRQHMKRFKKYDGFIANHGHFDIPEKLQFGFSYQFNPCLALAGDYEYIDWKSIKMLHNKGVFFKSLLGSNAGPGFGWKNQQVWRFGVNYALNRCFDLRLGFLHQNSPIKQRYTLINILTLDCCENLITCGASWYPDQCNELSFFYGIGLEKKIPGEDSVPAGFGGTQTATNSTDVSLKQHLFSVGLSWGRKF